MYLDLNAGYCKERLFAYIEQGCFVLQGSQRKYPVGGSVLVFRWGMFFFFFISPASFHGDDCSFDACAKSGEESGEGKRNKRAILY